MTNAQFLRTVMLLYGDHWQKPFAALLAQHGFTYTRQTFWNWKKGNTPVPSQVAGVLEAEGLPDAAK